MQVGYAGMMNGMQAVLESLHQGDYDTAFEALVRELALTQGQEAGEAALLLAEAYSLYGEGGLEGVYRALEEGQTAWSGLEAHPRYRAILGEIKALEGTPEEQVRAILPQESADPRVLYHQAQALMYLGWPEQALKILQKPLELPLFLAWRADTLKAKAYEHLGQPGEAAEAYVRAASGALGLERYWNLIDASAMYIEVGDGESAAATIAEAYQQVPLDEDLEDAATRYYLEARIQVLLGNPGLAMEAIRQAIELEHTGAEPAHGTPLVHGQILMQLGQIPEAVQAFREALRRSDSSNRSYIVHELAVATLESGNLTEAEGLLREILQDGEYMYTGEAWGDLAETLYRLGSPEAEQAAKQAIAHGAATAGKLILGNLAYDVLNLEQALQYYREVASESSEGHRDWITAHQMIVDTLVQLGFLNPSEIISSAESVVPYLHESDEWHQSLQNYVERANKLMGSRTLN
jgi:Flp pilus assembly protein TadD